MKRPNQDNLTQRNGALLPMLAVVMLMLMVIVSLGVDIARMHLTRSELRTANDAAARAAVVEIGVSENVEAAKNAAIAIAARNQVAGTGLTLEADQVAIGHAELQPSGSFQFTQGGPFLTSARVTGARDANSKDGPVSLLFGPMFGVEQFSTGSASAATQTHRDIALVLDVSGSMKNDGKFEALQEALAAFLEVLDGTPQSERVSLIVYSTTARKAHPITSDFSLINDAFASEEPAGNTAIGFGIREGIKSLLDDPQGRDHALKSVVVMTDGKHNTGIGPDVVADEANAKRVSVHAVTFSEDAEKGRMRNVAKKARGKHVHADDNEKLKEAFREIARQLSVSLIE